MFKKILVANRGEVAVRVVRACRDLGIQTVAVYSDPDRNSLHVRLADEAYRIGAAASSESYLRADAIVQVAKRTDAQAVHPGYGFLSESAEFAESCEKAGIVFIGPSPAAVRLMGDKGRARAAAIEAGVAVVPGAELTEPGTPLAVAKRVGFPLLVKAKAGGGGKGMRLAATEAEFEACLSTAKSEALSSFGSDEVYLERYIERPRHIEIQILADSHGHAIHLLERECSIQRRHQKLIEECPSPFLDDALRREMGAAALDITRKASYENAGTVEFLVDDERKFYFLEMNTRLQVEHPVTEMVTGCDLVEWQIAIAAGERLSLEQADIVPNGWAMEFRVTAEDAFQNFLPSAGRIRSLRAAAGPGIRNDSGIYAGWDVTPHYDPLLAKLIVHGRDRSRCLQRSRRAIREYRLEGIETTLPFFARMLDDLRFQRGEMDVAFVERNWKEMMSPDAASEPGDARSARIVDAARATAGVVFKTDSPTSVVADRSPNSAWRRRGWRDSSRR